MKEKEIKLSVCEVGLRLHEECFFKEASEKFTVMKLSFEERGEEAQCFLCGKFAKKEEVPFRKMILLELIKGMHFCSIPYHQKENF